MKMFIYKSGDVESHKEAGRKLREETKPGFEYVISVKKNNPIRSLNHNRYYRLCLKVIATKTGETDDRLHMLFKTMFNFESYPLPNGEIMRIPATTSDLDTAEFARYVNQVKQWAIDEFNVSFPERHDLDYMQEMDIENQYDKIQGA